MSKFNSVAFVVILDIFNRMKCTLNPTALIRCVQTPIKELAKTLITVMVGSFLSCCARRLPECDKYFVVIEHMTIPGGPDEWTAQMGLWYRFDAASEPELMAMVHSSVLCRVSNASGVPKSELRVVRQGVASPYGGATVIAILVCQRRLGEQPPVVFRIISSHDTVGAQTPLGRI
jgi:hypothetical protein